MKKRFLVSLYTGPTQVQAIADKLRKAGYEVTCEGTEHVHVWTNYSGWTVHAMLFDMGEDIGWVGLDQSYRHWSVIRTEASTCGS